MNWWCTILVLSCLDVCLCVFVAGFARTCRLRICSLIDRSSGEGFTDRFLRRRWWRGVSWNQTDHDRSWQIMTDHDRSWQNIQKGSQVELPFSKSVREHLTTWFRQWAKGTLVVGPIADCHPNTSRPWNLQNISSTQRIACTDGTTTSPTVRLASVVNTSMFGSSLEAEGNWSDWVARRKSGILWNLSWDGW